MKMTVALAAVAALGLSAAASADSQVFSANIENFGADGGGDGTAVTSSLIVDHVFVLPNIFSLDSISFDLAHSFLSDLHIEVIDPLGVIYIIAQGDGPAGNPHQGPGDGSDLGNGGSTLGGVLTYNFVASGGGLWNGNPATAMPAGDYNALNWAAGSYAAGNWTIRLWDSWDTLDDGAVGDVTITYSVPAPGALALLGLAGLVGGRRRRA